MTNILGSATQPVSVRIRNIAATNNVTQCCLEQNVTNSCMDACSFHLDIDAVIDKPECLNDFDKLMKCAADGSDHRNCCAQNNVPRRCLDYCRGEPILNNKMCVLSYTKQIMSCFHEGRLVTAVYNSTRNLILNWNYLLQRKTSRTTTECTRRICRCSYNKNPLGSSSQKSPYC